MKTNYNLVYTKNIAETLDRELSIIIKEIKRSGDPDSFGLLDQYEQIQ